MELGIQVSSLKPLLNTPEQVDQVFARMAQMGCRWVQLQWIDPAVSPEDIAAALNRHGLRSVSVQDFCTSIRETLEYYVNLNQRTGGRWLCVSRIPEEYKSPQGLAAFAREMEALNEKISPLGQQVCFHPVSADFQAVPELDAVEVLLKKLPWMPLCLDLYHLNRCCGDMPGYIRRHAGRICMVHFKDSRDGRLVPAGQGDTPWEGVAQACRDAGVEYAFVEQETWDGDPFQCLQEALGWLKQQ